MSGSVEVDTSRLARFVSRLAGTLATEGPTAARRRADLTAGRVRSGVPVRTGRLAATVETSPYRTTGAAVHYGGRLGYGRKIENKYHAVRDGIRDSRAEFYEDGKRVARVSVKRLK